MDKTIVCIILSMMCLLTAFTSSVAIQIDEVGKPLIPNYFKNLQIPTDDDPEGKDGPDDYMDYYYLLCGILILFLLPRGVLHIIRSLGNPGNLIASLIGSFGAGASVVIAALEAFDYKDVDGDGC